MTTAPDGSPVELYALVPERGEGDLVAVPVPPPARLLERWLDRGRGWFLARLSGSPERL